MKHLLRMFALTVLLLGQTPAFSQVDPAIRWNAMELSHFRLIYDASYQELANYYAARLDPYYELLETVFPVRPDKITVVIMDRTDLTNGYATPIPYAHIVIYPVLPGAQESIGEYGDWGHELMVHEYSHILAFAPKRDVVQILSYIFGTAINPNVYLPRWFHEGLAVEIETRFSSHGRLRSTYQDATLRALKLGHRLQKFDIAEINETSLHTFPQGSRPYLLGSTFWSDIMKEKDESIASGLLWRYGGRLPWIINAPAEDYLGMKYSTLFAKHLTALSDRIDKQLAILTSAPPTEGQTFSRKKQESYVPVLSPDGLKLILIGKDETLRRSLQILKRDKLEDEFSDSENLLRPKEGELLKDYTPPLPGGDSPPTGTLTRVSWFPDSKRILLDRVRSINRYHETSDLFIFDLDKEESEPLTHHQRAREGTVSPDGKTVAFVQLSPGATGLSLFDVESKKVESLFTLPLGDRVSWPVFLTNQQLLFSLRENGKEGLFTYDLQSKERKAVFADFPNARFAQNTANGILFSSTKNGIANLYLAKDLASTPHPLTHSQTAIFYGDLDQRNGRLYYSELSSDGFQLKKLDQTARFQNTKLPDVSPLFVDRYPADKTVPTFSLTSKPEIHSYSPWSYLLPRYWFPGFYTDGSDYSISVETAGYDPLAKHSYALLLAYDSATKEGTYLVNYLNTSFPAYFGISLADIYSTLGNLSTKTRTQNYLAYLSWQLSGISTDLETVFGWRWQNRDYSTSKRDLNGPYAAVSYLGYSQTGAQISPEVGWGASFQATHFQKSETSTGFNEYRLTLQKYISQWLPKRHAIMLRARGQYIDRPARDITTADYESTYNNTVYADAMIPLYVVRGFPNGAFLGKSLALYTFEYRFPLNYTYKGYGTAPFSFRRLHAAIVADGIQVDGARYNLNDERYYFVDRWRQFWSAGVEIKSDTTILYHVPVTFYVGAYSSFEGQNTNQNQVVIGFQAE